VPLLLQAVSERAKDEASASDDGQQCCVVVPVEQLVKFVWGLLVQGATAAAATTATAAGGTTGT
jgi:hypothetical protein